MIRICTKAWKATVEHALVAYPEECCGVLLGPARLDEKGAGDVSVLAARAFENAALESTRTHYAFQTGELVTAEREARTCGLSIVGVYHSHPDSGTGFSPTDLENSWPWYFYLVLSIRGGRFAGAAAWMANSDRTSARDFPLLIEP